MDRLKRVVRAALALAGLAVFLDRKHVKTPLRTKPGRRPQPPKPDRGANQQNTNGGRKPAVGKRGTLEIDGSSVKLTGSHTFNPGGMEGYFAELFELIRGEGKWPLSDMGKVTALARRYDTYPPNEL
jgi:hypothetical protein